MSFIVGVPVGTGACFVGLLIAAIARYSEQEKIRQEKERLIALAKRGFRK